LRDENLAFLILSCGTACAVGAKENVPKHKIELKNVRLGKIKNTDM